MPYLRSAGPSSMVSQPGTSQTGYQHGVDVRRQFIPMAWQITSPFNNRHVLMPHALVMHINPQSFDETFTKKIERFQTRGGWVEQHWGDELGDISADGTTGAFMNLYTGLTSVMRQRTIAWDRFRDLHDLYKNNGSLYDPAGNIVLQGDVMLLYDRGTFLGTFKTFNVEEDEGSPFSFKVSWSFRVKETILRIPGTKGTPGRPVVFQPTDSPDLISSQSFVTGLTGNTAQATAQRATESQNADLKASAQKFAQKPAGK